MRLEAALLVQLRIASLCVARRLRSKESRQRDAALQDTYANSSRDNLPAVGREHNGAGTGQPEPRGLCPQRRLALSLLL